MREQLNFMAERAEALNHQAYSNFPESFVRVRDVHHEELKS